MPEKISEQELDYIETHRRFKAHPHGIDWKALLSSPNFLALLLMFHFYMYAAYFYYSWMPRSRSPLASDKLSISPLGVTVVIYQAPAVSQAFPGRH